MKAGLPLPGGPPGSSAYKSWLSTVTSELPTLHSAAPDNTFADNWYSKSVSYPTWAGYEDYQNSYGMIQGQWDMANVSSSLAQGQGISQWVGIGGDENNDGGFASLVQSGGEIFNYQSNGSTVANMFVEMLSDYNTTPINWCFASGYGSIAPGNNLWGEEEFKGTVDFNGTSYDQYNAIANDVTNSQTTNWQTVDCPSNYVNNSAEAVLEDPANGAVTLPYFSSTADFWNIYTYPPGGEVNGEVAPYILMNLRNGNGSNATPTGWTSETSFGVNYGT